MTARRSLLISLSILAILSASLKAEERTHTAEQAEALAKGGDLTAELPPKLRNLPDLTKGDPVPSGGRTPHTVWTFGPTGIIGIMVGRYEGYQIAVKGALKGSPSEGKILEGDVITGINGEAFRRGGHLGVTIGNAIIEAEKKENGGKIRFSVWRDKNYLDRQGSLEVFGKAIDIDQLITEARDDNSLYEWKGQEERTEELRDDRYSEHPVDGVTLEVELTLRTFPEYSDTAPYDCPKTLAILEDAYKILEKKFVVDPEKRGRGRGGIIEAIALIASGKPEHRELVHDWVRGQYSPWKPPSQPAGEMFKPEYRGHKGYQSWHHGYNGLYCALYYDATGDDYVLPALRKYALDTALGQSALGSWGHTFAYPAFNGGEFHRMNPGYGALNAAGNRCFFLITLAEKLGIDHPEIKQAVKRAYRFFGSYVDQGCIPYGDHPAYGSDDSNGKNSGVAYSMKLLGDDHAAKYFSMMSSRCSFSRRGGHGHDYHGNWSYWSANLSGPEVRILGERNLRWRRTLCRMFDGRFVYHSPTGGYKTLRDPTATEVLTHSVIFKQTLITGKDPNPALYPDKREVKQLLSSAYGMLNDPWLKQKVTGSLYEGDTAELLDDLDIFYPKARSNIGRELARRYKNGEQEILERLIALLKHESPRYRDGALHALEACGEEVILSNLTQLIPLMSDPEDFVRVSTAGVINRCQPSREAQAAVLEATIDTPRAIAPNSVRNAAMQLFAKNIPLANQPFESGFDQEKVYRALESLILLDPARHRTLLQHAETTWSKETIIRLAGPLTYAAEEEQIADQMNANRSGPAQRVLGKFAYREAALATAHRLQKQAGIPRYLRPHVSFKRPLMDADTVKNDPAVFIDMIAEMETVLTDNPNAALENKSVKPPVTTPLHELYKLVKSTENKPSTLPSIASDVNRHFQLELDELDNVGAKIKFCRKELSDISRKTTFRKLTAMDVLAELLGPDAIEDLVPYLSHREMRLRDHSRQLTANLIRIGGGPLLEQATTPENMTGVLYAYGLSGQSSGVPIARKALSHELPSVRSAALETLARIDKEQAIGTILDHLESITVPEERIGAENALLAIARDPSAIPEIREGAVKLTHSKDPGIRATSYYLLSRLGDDASIAQLRKVGKTDSLKELDRLAEALSYSSNRKADQLMLDLASTDKKSAQIVGNHSVRRLVLGPKGFGDITDSQRMDFAEPMLNLDMNRRLIQFLGKVHHARALRALMSCLERGYGGAAESLIANAETAADDYKADDAKIAATVLENVIEYIEVTHLRGGPNDQEFYRYPKWKALQARAGKVLLKVHQPQAEPIPTFDLLDFE